jgi:hypothetical protein
MEAAGSTDPSERARAAATLAELIEWAATALHTECNSRRVEDCREVLPARLPPSLTGDAEKLFETLVEPGDIAGPLWPDDWHSEVCRAFGPARL